MTQAGGLEIAIFTRAIRWWGKKIERIYILRHVRLHHLLLFLSFLRFGEQENSGSFASIRFILFWVCRRESPRYSATLVLLPLCFLQASLICSSVTFQFPGNFFPVRVKNGTIEVVYNFIEYGGFSIAELESVEAARDFFADFPSRQLFDWEVKPLLENKKALEGTIKRLEKAVKKKK